MNRSYYSVMNSAVGPLTLRWSGDALVGVYFQNHLSILERRGEWTRDDDALAPVRAQLEEYFRGERTTFDLPLAPEGTPFQLRTWEALRAIPFGETRSYGEQARAMGAAMGAPAEKSRRGGWGFGGKAPNERAGARAVGAANGKNPISIIVPCHRVIGADGSLTGFGGGLPAKRWLLAHEGNFLDLKLSRSAEGGREGHTTQRESKNFQLARGASDQRL